MKKVQILSIVAVIVTIGAFVISRSDIPWFTESSEVVEMDPGPPISKSEYILESLNRLELLNNNDYLETLSEMEMKREHERRKIERYFILGGLKRSLIPLNDLLETDEVSNTQKSTFGMKEIFSIIFCIAALYVVLFGKYPEDTRKWAFSLLSLIAGVWIGSI